MVIWLINKDNLKYTLEVIKYYLKVRNNYFQKYVLEVIKQNLNVRNKYLKYTLGVKKYNLKVRKISKVNFRGNEV